MKRLALIGFLFLMPVMAMGDEICRDGSLSSSSASGGICSGHGGLNSFRRTERTWQMKKGPSGYPEMGKTGPYRTRRNIQKRIVIPGLKAPGMIINKRPKKPLSTWDNGGDGPNNRWYLARPTKRHIPGKVGTLKSFKMPKYKTPSYLKPTKIRGFSTSRRRR